MTQPAHLKVPLAAPGMCIQGCAAQFGHGNTGRAEPTDNDAGCQVGQGGRVPQGPTS